MTRRSWSHIRPAEDEKRVKSLTQSARDAIRRMPQEDWEAVSEWLVRTMIMRAVAIGADDGAFRDAEAERRVALNIIALRDGPNNEPRGSD